MCLDTIEKEDLSKPERSGTGWKVFERILGNRIKFEYYQLDYKPTVPHVYIPLNEWITAKPCKEITEFYPSQVYETGFHIFKSRKSARGWAHRNDCLYDLVVRKVKYQKARIFGIQERHVVIVADKMLVLPGTKG